MTDVIRPLPWKEVAFDVEASLFSYMDGLENAFEEYCHQTPEARESTYFNYNLYHVPFPGISKEAHKVLLELQGLFGKEALATSFKQKSHAIPVLRAKNRRDLLWQHFPFPIFTYGESTRD